MTTEQIKCFFKVAETESFTEAAELLYMTQPSLSKKINALERELNLRLFSRDKSTRTHLTAAGRVLYEGFIQMEQEFVTLMDQARNAQNGVTGTVRLAIFENQLMDEYLQEIINDFSRRNPGVEMYVTTNTFNGMIHDIQEGRLDCAVTIGYDLKGRKRLKHRELYHLKTLLVVPERFVRETRESYHLQDFADCPFLTIQESTNHFQHRMLVGQLEEAGISPELITARDDRNFMMLLEMGKGIAILDSYSKCCKAPGVICISVPEIAPSPFELVWLEGNKNQAFLTFLKYLTFEDRETR